MSDTPKTIGDLIQDSRNANKGTAKGQKMLVGSIQRSKLGRSIVIDKNNQIIGGNKTVEAVAEALGVDAKIKVIEDTGDELIVRKRLDLDLSDPDPNNPARQLAHSDNIVSWANYSPDLPTFAADIEAGFDFAAIDVSLPDLGLLLERDVKELLGGEAGKDTDAKISKADELQAVWQVNPGQMFACGEHRIICGDCTDRETVEKVMGGEKAAIQIQDPPYGIDLDTDYSYLNDINSSTRYKFPEGIGGNYNKVVNDDKQFQFDRFNVIETKEAFWWGANYYHFQLPMGGSWLVWDKQTNENAGKVLDSIGSSFELCWSKVQHRQEIIRKLWRGYFGTETQDIKSRLHPTQKPIEVISWILEKYCMPRDICADFFLGSGTTLIACHNLNRRCRGIELHPPYVAVCLQRFLDHTGIQPQLLTEG